MWGLLLNEEVLLCVSQTFEHTELLCYTFVLVDFSSLKIILLPQQVKSSTALYQLCHD